ncbi:MAG: CDP-diacylglycerol--glycerol-3-phosphate 3-phosphatidyltransferase [Flexistipes sinusarabici]|uniref:CDP-diacylglycerol--glycerol-3-phosphate 3-phosphatidyltransferase n=1 Tax=Flexistipes sinusarabici TaxID=2352 RepID=A0A5D0MK05_FLESI|nr:CDP-alcohol phosphatidyltransferase family protein [Flexistipes sinusarabici]TYB34007.1 MAG: CDP-diacylglycerol--glycerol-3-phosphate 3-phosphatidyltransferase [Flexistipes sinusarabici]
MINIPNILTILRILLLPFFIVKLSSGEIQQAFFIFLVAAFTDLLDGFIARKFSMITSLGQILDPLADKIMIIGGFVAIYLSDLPIQISSFFLFFVYLKEFYTVIGILVIYLFKGKVNIQPNIFGKMATFMESLTILILLVSNLTGMFAHFVNYFAVATIGFIAASIVSYTLNGINYMTKNEGYS